MKLGKLYELVIKLGIENDPRGKLSVEKEVAGIKKRYAGLNSDEKKNFDLESLKNPYADTRILNGSKEKRVKNILVGIDIETAELLLAERLSAKKKIDLVISHHPQGAAYAGFYDVMKMQAEIFGKMGVPISVAEGLTALRMQQVSRRVHPANHLRTTDAARLLDINLMCLHTPSDNCVATYLQKLINDRNPETASDVLDILNKIPEYKHAAQNNASPKIILGDAGKKCGKVFVDMTGGTEGPKDIIPKLSAAGISTIVGMHMSEENFKKAKSENINVIIAGHISSDNLGLNLLLDKVEKKEKLNIIEISGFRRIKR